MFPIIIAGTFKTIRIAYLIGKRLTLRSFYLNFFILYLHSYVPNAAYPSNLVSTLDQQNLYHK